MESIESVVEGMAEGVLCPRVCVCTFAWFELAPRC